MEKIIIAIDGPAGSGKSTVAKMVAEAKGLVYMDTGAMYRAITYMAIKNNIVDDTNSIIELVKKIKLILKFENGLTRVFVDDEEVTDFIRSPEVNSRVSEVSKIPEVRYELVNIQQKIGKDSSVIADGRDTTTVVFPDADYKIYLNANIDVRAERRLKEFLEKDVNITLEDVKNNLAKRDKIDSSREVSPLRKAEDAIEIDTSYMTIEEEVAKICELINNI